MPFATDYEVRVERGIARLDRAYPAWENRINADRLRVSNSARCPLGQLYGDFKTGVDALGLPGGEVEEYGFYAIGPLGFLRLTRLWKRKIRARLAAKRDMELTAV